MHCDHARFVWNLALEQRSMWRPGRRSITGPEQERQLTEARAEFEWLRAGVASVQHQAIRDLDQAFQNFFGRSHRYPSWRRKGEHEGFRVVGMGSFGVRSVSARWGEVRVPKLGWVRYRSSRPLPDGVKSCRITLDAAGRWHVSFTTPQPEVIREATGAVIGLDRGVANSVATSDGEMHHAPTLRPKERERRMRLERRLAHQQRGSEGRIRTRRQLARIRAREADRRKDWVEKLTTDLVRSYDRIVIEDLRTPNMVRKGRGKRGLNREIHAQAWGLLGQRLKDKAGAATSPVEIIEVNPAYTSQTCHACGHVARSNRQSQSGFECGSCGHQAHADVNAALNILAAGSVVTARGAPALVEAAKREPVAA